MPILEIEQSSPARVTLRDGGRVLLNVLLDDVDLTGRWQVTHCTPQQCGPNQRPEFDMDNGKVTIQVGPNP